MAVRATELIEDRREQFLPVLSDKERKRLRQFGCIVHFAKGERLTTTGEDVPGMFVILSGHVAVREHRGLSVGDLTRLEPGMFLADMGQLAGLPALVDAVAETTSKPCSCRPLACGNWSSPTPTWAKRSCER